MGALKAPVVTPADKLGPAPAHYFNAEAIAPSNAGQAVAKGFEHLGGVLGKIALDEERKHNESTALAMFDTLGKWTQANVEDPQAGALSKRGGAAVGVTDKTLKDFDEFKGQLLALAPNEHVAQEVEKYAVQHKAVLGHRLAAYEGQQLRAQDDANFKAGLDRTVSNAGLFWRDEAAVDMQLRIGAAAISSRADAEKWTLPQLEDALRDHRTRVLSTVIENAAKKEGGDIAYATRLFKRYTGADIDLARSAIRNADGTISTERTITIEADDRHHVIPTIVQGEQLTNEAAIEAWRAGKNPAVGSFNTAKEAESYAQERTQRIGELRQGDTSRLISGDHVKRLADLIGNADVRDQAYAAVDRLRAAHPYDLKAQADGAKALPPEVREKVVPLLAQLDGIDEKDRQHGYGLNASSLIVEMDKAVLGGKPVTLDETDPRYRNLDSAHQKIVTGHLLALQGKSRVERSEAFKAARNDFMALPTANQIQLNIDTAYPDLHPTDKDALRVLQKKSVVEWNKDHGAKADQIKADVGATADKLNYTKKLRADFLAHIISRLALDFPNKDAPPTQLDVLKVIADETVKVKYGRTDTFGSAERWRVETDEAPGTTGEVMPPAKQVTVETKAHAEELLRTGQGTHGKPAAPQAKPAEPPPLLKRPPEEQPVKETRLKPIPDAVKAKIKAQLEAAGRPADDTAIDNVWLSMPHSRGN